MISSLIIQSQMSLTFTYTDCLQTVEKGEKIRLS